MRAGRPFRALGGLAILVLAWLGWRAPDLVAEAERLSAGFAGPRPPAPVLMAHRAAPPLPPAPAVMVAMHQPAHTVRVRAVAPAAPRHISLPPLGVETPMQSPPVLPEPVTGAGPATAAGNGQAFQLAEEAYRRLRAGQRREAAALFDGALRLEPGNRQWWADRQALGRRWQAGGFWLARDGGPQPNAPGSGLPGLAASPVLGGGQVGASLAWLPDPLARRPLAVVARANMAASSAGLQQETAQLAIGLRQTLLPGFTLSVERLIALGNGTRSDWTLRLAGGGARGRLQAYGEAGVLAGGTVYGGAQAQARLLAIGPAMLGGGAWASVQTGTPDVWRVDVGPSVAATVKGLRLQADWRERVAGNAAPGSGPVVTLSAGF